MFFRQTYLFYLPVFYSLAEKPVDLVFCIGSQSIVNYEKMKIIVKNLTDAYDIGPSKTRVGLVEYSGAAEVLVFLKDSYTKAQFKMFIERMSRRSGGTLTGALKKVRLLLLFCAYD